MPGRNPKPVLLLLPNKKYVCVHFIFDLLTMSFSPQEPGIGNVFDGSGERAAFAGAGGRSRGA